MSASTVSIICQRIIFVTLIPYFFVQGITDNVKELYIISICPVKMNMKMLNSIVS